MGVFSKLIGTMANTFRIGKATLDASSLPTVARSYTFPATGGVIALTTSNVASATVLATARTVNNISFDGSANITVPPFPAQGRLAATEASPFPSVDISAATAIYYCPFGDGGQLALHDGSATWTYYTLVEFAGALGTLTASIGYDVFAFASTATPSSTNTTTDVVTFGSATGWLTGAAVTVAATGSGLTSGIQYWWNAASTTTGTFHTTLANAMAGTSKVDLTGNVTAAVSALSLSFLAWSSSTARATALIMQNGVYVLTGATNKRYLGSFYTSSTTTTESSATQRFLWNFYNQIELPLAKVAATAYTYQSTTSIAFNNDSTQKVELFIGITGMSLVQLQNMCNVYANTATAQQASGRVGIGVDSALNDNSITNNVAGYGARTMAPSVATWRGRPSLGYHFYQNNVRCTDVTAACVFQTTSSGYGSGGLTGTVVA